MFLLEITFLACSISFPVALPSSINVEDRQNEYSEGKGGYFQGDMILDGRQMQVLRSYVKNGLSAEMYRWPKNTVYYDVDSMFKESQRAYILKAFRTIESVTCVKFAPRLSSFTHYVNITGKNSGCFSNVGFLKRVQTINLEQSDLGSGCFRLGTIMHELIHTLGFYHQQSASNRDDYVTIVKGNIEPRFLFNFDKYPQGFITDFGVPYDYGSVMHYPKTAFSKNGLPTIVPKKPNVEIGQRERLSNSDVLKIKKMYKCP